MTRRALAQLPDQPLSYSIGFTLPENTPDLLELIAKNVWADPVYTAALRLQDLTAPG